MKNKQKDYIVITEDDLDLLEESVNDWLEQGYLLSGGICFMDDHGDFSYCQAVYKNA